MPQVFLPNPKNVSVNEALEIYRAAAKVCGDINWQDAHPLAFLTSLIYDGNVSDSIKLRAAQFCLQFIMSTPERVPRQLENIPLADRYPSLQILLNAPEARPN